ncbi:hypothetical protein ABIB85_005138 [Bradyrhizobium sp. JR1.5]|uniref:hypothetical protein n=1 Tax=unclassified Bradyrhizobium TaxID=2631580 RepID=UPI0033975EFA
MVLKLTVRQYAAQQEAPFPLRQQKDTFVALDGFSINRDTCRNGESQWISSASGAGLELDSSTHTGSHGYAAVIEIRLVGKTVTRDHHATRQAQERLIISVFQLTTNTRTVITVWLRLRRSAKRLGRNIIRIGSAVGAETKLL